MSNLWRFSSNRDLKAGRGCLDYLEQMGLRWVFSLPLQEHYHVMCVRMQVTLHTHVQLTGKWVGIHYTVKMHSTDHRCNCAVTAENLVSCCRYLLEPGCTSGVLGGHLGEVNFLRNYVKQVSEPRCCKCQVRLP